ncbi:tyrosine-protein phosphatase non-receptor type 5 isoform X9 [Salminus brasiliensis]|uniref:tyrosine-protein phosphatase non-receptor type 5 isoform X9 n=1 Tax=Salminus brasiliensis TaxID=930266 RepID=UPI003B837617
MAESPTKQDMPREQGSDATHTPSHPSLALWSRMWRASITAGAFLLLYTLSQVTDLLDSSINLGLWVLYMLNGYRAFPAAHKVLDLLQYLLSTADSSDQQMEIWRAECVCPLLATLFLGVVILGTGALFCVRTLVPGSSTGFPDDRRQSMSRQPSFTYSEWTDVKQEDFYDLDAVPETPVFDCFMDMKTEGDPTTLTVKPVGLQERRGSNVSLTLDMCTPGTTEPYGALLSPREQSTQEYLENASNPLTPGQLHMRALDDAALHAEFYETPMNFVDPKEYNIPGVVRKNRYKTILPNTHSRVCLQSTEEDFLSTYINANYLKKCTEYWPESSVIWEGIEITVNQVIQADDYSLRNFTVKFEGEERSLTHYWYTSWPDQKTPDKAPPLLQLVQEVEEAKQNAARHSGPIIVHCSAGIGRTGCFIATTILCEQLRREGIVDILRTTSQLRLDRRSVILLGRLATHLLKKPKKRQESWSPRQAEAMHSPPSSTQHTTGKRIVLGQLTEQTSGTDLIPP